jgi:hypothetical protein
MVNPQPCDVIVSLEEAFASASSLSLGLFMSHSMSGDEYIFLLYVSIVNFESM